MARLVVLDFIKKDSFKKTSVSKWKPSSSAQCVNVASELSSWELVVLFRIRNRAGRLPIGVLAVIESLARVCMNGVITPIVLKREIRKVHKVNLAAVEKLPEHVAASYDLERMRLLEDFLRSNVLGWAALGEVGTKLIIHRGTRADSYLEWLGRLLLSGKNLNFDFGLAVGPSRSHFCELCWRFKMSTLKYCSYHSPGGNSQGQESLRAGTHKSASRLKPLFDSWRKRLEGDDRKLKLRSEWRRSVDQGLLGDWLKLRRPRVCEWLALSNVSVSNLNEVIVGLDRIIGESAQEAMIRGVFHQDLINDAAAAFTMISRAEAWMCAAYERKDNWGGSRRGAGRKSTGF